MLFFRGNKEHICQSLRAHTKVLIRAHERGIVGMQDRGRWFIKIPSHQMNEMLCSGVGHFFNTLLN